MAIQKISEKTKKRCEIKELDAKLRRQFVPVSLEFFHFFYDVESIDFPLYFRLENLIIEFIKPNEFCKDLLAQLWQSLLRPHQDVDLCIRKSDQGKLFAMMDRIRGQKIRRLLSQHEGLDPKVLDIFDKMSNASQLVVKGGLNPLVISSVGQSAEYLVDNLVDSERVIGTLSRMIAIDPTLYDHSASVAMIAAIIGTKLLDKKMSKKEARVLAEGGMYHDVGKTCVPSAILNKPGKFTPEEFEIMKTHAALGEDELLTLIEAGSDIDDRVARVAGEHHENFCGHGYPRGRKGRHEDDPENGIHLHTRIVTIADVYSALLMKRVYKEAFDPLTALEIMKKSTEKYDPEIFQLFLDEVTRSLEASDDDPKRRGRILHIDNGKLKIVSA